MSVSSLFGFTVRLALHSDFPALSDLEAASFPEDEMASEETMRTRCQDANPYFILVEDPSNGQIVGFINGTCSPHKEIHHESMSSHDPTGNYLVIHSVTIAHNYRRRSLGGHMLRDYMNYLTAHRPEIVGVNLLSKAYLLEFYQRTGFKIIGPSHVEHGQEMWFDLSMDLESKRREVYTVDAFAAGPFKGNPACVVFQIFSCEVMQKIAMEMNKPATVFLSERPSAEASRPMFPSVYRYDIRWFSSETEINLCGHGTLAACYALYQSQRVPTGAPIMFHCALVPDGIAAKTTPDGMSSASGKSSLVEICLPARPPQPYLCSPEDLAILCSSMEIDDPDIVAAAAARDMLLIEIKASAFHGIPSDFRFAGLERLNPVFAKVVVTCAGTKYDSSGISAHCADTMSAVKASEYMSNTDSDFCSRCVLIYRNPRCLVIEDAVTGSAHAALAPYWRARLNALSSQSAGLGLDEVGDVDCVVEGAVPEVLVGYQCSSRGGLVFTRTAEGKVFLAGPAVLVATSTLLL